MGVGVGGTGAGVVGDPVKRLYTRAKRQETAYRYAARWTAAMATRTRIANAIAEPLPVVVPAAPLYVSSSFLTTSLGCLSYSAVDRRCENATVKICSNGSCTIKDIIYTAGCTTRPIRLI